jgi:hypothetical protein
MIDEIQYGPIQAIELPFYLAFIARDPVKRLIKIMVNPIRRGSDYFRIAVLLLIIPSAVLQAAPVLMISVDGLKPEYITHASEYGLHVPTLRRFVTEGTYAEGVIPVLPSVTYPDHTTLITGVWPIEHGILNNALFHPEHKYAGAWYWYASSIRVPTLWDAAHGSFVIRCRLWRSKGSLT